jgi:flagellar motor switch protein FliM
MSGPTAILDPPAAPAAEATAPASPETSIPTTALEAETPAAAQPVAAAQPAPAANGPAVVDYDWRVPRRFIPTERQRLQDFAAAAAADVAAELAGFLRIEIAVQTEPVTEHYAAEAWDAQAAPAYWTPLANPEGRACGLLAFPPHVALGWIEHLLGGKAPSGATRRDLTALESALLLDIAAVITKALAAASRKAGGPDFRHMESLAANPTALAGPASAECCRFMLTTVAAAGRSQIGVVLASDLLATVANPQSAAQKPRPPQDIRQDILKHLEGVAVSTTVRLGTAAVSMRDIAGLEVDDVLLLNDVVGSPIVMLVRGNPSHVGLPVQCEGAYAFQVMEQRQWPRLSMMQKGL